MSSYMSKGPNERKCRSDKRHSSSTVTEAASPTVQLFKAYQIELDAKYDKRERLVKKCRDLTVESKRIIFLLHRVSYGNNEGIFQEAEKRLANLFMTTIKEIALELNKREVYQFIKYFSAGLQEFVEAVSFYHYLRNENLITLQEVYNPSFLEKADVPEKSCSENESEGMKPELPLAEFLTPVDYVLGISDLTGELMRKCISCISTGNVEEPFKMSVILQNIHNALMVSGRHSKELRQKLYILKCSLKKVENACYAIKIRGSDTPKHMLADFFSTEDDDKGHDMCDL